MWPHHIVVGLGDLAISVGSDSAIAIERLEPWRVDIEADLVDFALEAAPARSDQQPGLRRIPRLTHGTCDLVRLRDTGELTVALMRTLASFSSPPSSGRVRIGLMPIVHGGRALLLPIEHGGKISRRWYGNRSIHPIYAVSSVVDVARGVVEIDVPLGDAADLGGQGTSYPLADWWLPSADLTVGLTPGHAVAQAMRLARDVTASNAQETLDSVASFVGRRPPSLVPAAMDNVLEQFDPAGANAIRSSVMDQIDAVFARDHPPSGQSQHGAVTRS